MYKLGILGTCNTHAVIFSNLFNKPDCSGLDFYGYGKAKVEYIFGFDKENAVQIANDSAIENVVTKASEMYDKVDAALVIFRNGIYHARYAIPFLERRIPVFIDKPFTLSEKDALSIIRTAEKFNTPLMGGSSLKYAPDTRMFKDFVARENTDIKSATLSFPATINNPYGNLHFYGSHLVETALEIFGYDCKTVKSFERNGAVTSVLGYDKYNIVLNFIPDAKYNYCAVFTSKDTIVKDIDISTVFKEQMRGFIEMLETRIKPQDLNNLYKSVRVLNSIIKSYEKRQEIIIKD